MANSSNTSATNATVNLTIHIREDTDIEVVFYLTCMGLFTLVICSTNISLITVILKFKNILRPCNRIIRITIAIFDIIICITTASLLTAILMFKIKTATLFCVINSKMLVVSFLMSMGLCSLLAVEQYIYIVKPMKYHRWVTKSKVLLLISGMFILASIHSIGKYLWFDTRIRLSSFICKYSGEGFSWVMITCTLLAMLIFICISVALYLFQKKRTTDAQSHINANADGSIARKAMKLIILVSGSQLLTFIPGFGARFVILRVWSEQELEAGVNVPVLTMVRLMCMAMSVISATCNPICQFVIEKDLFVGLRKMLGQNVYFLWQREILSAVNTKETMMTPVEADIQLSRLMHTGGAGVSGLRAPVDNYNPAVHTEVIDAQHMENNTQIFTSMETSITSVHEETTEPSVGCVAGLSWLGVTKSTPKPKAKVQHRKKNKLINIKCDHIGCNFGSRYPGSLKNHKLKYHGPYGIRQHNCSQCNRKFLYNSESKRHMKIHTNLGYVCHKFRSRSGLVHHMISSHGQTGEYMCGMAGCSRSFSRKDILKDHIDKHMGVRSYECNFCSKKFNSKPGWYHHVKRCGNATAALVHICVTCKKKFSTKVDLQQHKL